MRHICWNRIFRYECVIGVLQGSALNSSKIRVIITWKKIREIAEINSTLHFFLFILGADIWISVSCTVWNHHQVSYTPFEIYGEGFPTWERTHLFLTYITVLKAHWKATPGFCGSRYLRHSWEVVDCWRPIRSTIHYPKSRNTSQMTHMYTSFTLCDVFVLQWAHVLTHVFRDYFIERHAMAYVLMEQPWKKNIIGKILGINILRVHSSGESGKKCYVLVLEIDVENVRLHISLSSFKWMEWRKHTRLKDCLHKIDEKHKIFIDALAHLRVSV